MAYINQISCIYKLYFKGYDKIYVGLTKNFAARKSYHFNKLSLGKHDNIYIQRAYNKYGHENLRVEIIEECEIKDLIEKEKHYISELSSFKKGFNLTTGGERFLFSEDVKKRISEKHKGKVLKESTKQKLREINTGKKMSQESKDKISFTIRKNGLTDEQRAKISKAAKFVRTEETKLKISISNTGKVPSKETKLKLAAFNLKRIRPNSLIEIKDGKVYIDGYEYIKGKRIPPEEEAFQIQKEKNLKEGRIKASIKRMGHIVSDETRAKLSKANKGRKMTEEQRIANSERQKGKKQSEEFKQKLRDYFKRKRQEKWDASQKF